MTGCQWSTLRAMDRPLKSAALLESRPGTESSPGTATVGLDTGIRIPAWSQTRKGMRPFSPGVRCALLPNSMSIQREASKMTRLIGVARWRRRLDCLLTRSKKKLPVISVSLRAKTSIQSLRFLMLYARGGRSDHPQPIDGHGVCSKGVRRDLGRPAPRLSTV